jgi:hypothetical protein
MRYVTVHLRCDKEDCTVVGEEGDGTVVERTLSIDGKRGKTFLLCKPHLDELDEQLLPLMAKGVLVEVPLKGRRSAGNGSGTSSADTGGSSSSSAPLPHDADVPERLRCKVPDCLRPMKNRAGAAQHVIRSHGYDNLDAYEAEYGRIG